MRAAGFFAVILSVLTYILFTPSELRALSCAAFRTSAGSSSGVAEAGKVATESGEFQPTKGRLSALVVFARFRDETSAGDTSPGFAAALLDPQRPGSLSHFYDTMSFGQLRVRGTVSSRRYASRHAAATYVADDNDQVGAYGGFVLEILEQLDRDVDLSRFDNDGPDGIADSGDDDGIVDYLAVVVASTPERFIRGRADGVAGLGFDDDSLAAARR